MSKKRRTPKKRLIIFPIEFIFKYIDEHPNDTRMIYEGYNFSIRRSIIHKATGIVCVKCNLKGYHYVLEEWYNGNLHLDLYAILPDGSERLMTIDHITPRSKGGEDEMNNYQMMCCCCNREKGDKIITNQEQPVEAEYLLETAYNEIK